MIEKKYAILIAVMIILVLFLGFFYFYNSKLKNLINANGNAPGGNIPPEVPINKVLGFASTSCSVSNNVDIIKFKIQNGATGIGKGEISAYLDNSLADFKDSNGDSVDSISLAANSVSSEFSYTAANHQPSRKITVAFPTGSFDNTTVCS